MRCLERNRVWTLAARVRQNLMLNFCGILCSDMFPKRGLAASLLAMICSIAWAADDSTIRTLPQPVARVLSAHNLRTADFSAYIQEVGQDNPILEINPDIARNPASTIKLLTTWLALETLGPAYTWKTEAYLDGPVGSGFLEGDLYLKGYGDPYMVLERYWLFLRKMRQQGLRHVTGDIVIDNSYFDLPSANSGEFDGQAARSYNVIPDAFMVNFQTVRFTFEPDLATNRVKVIAEPEPVNLQIRNRLVLKGGCGGYQRGIGFSIARPPGNSEVDLSGSFGRSCKPYSISRAVLQAPTFAYGVFRSLWEESGGTVQGGVRVDVVPDDIDAFVTMKSPPLSEVIRGVNKWSNNIMARHIFLTMGAEEYGSPATLSKSRDAARRYLAERNLNFTELKLENGAGLSRDTRISARSLGRLLVAAGDSIFQPEFVSSLAIAGMDGTMRRRFRDEALSGRMHLKTGRLSGVFALAGYVVSKTGRQFAFVAIHNGPGADKGPGEEAHSALLRWVYRQ